MQDPFTLMTLAATSLAAVTILAISALKGWNGWLDYKRAELARRGGGFDEGPAPSSAGARIEIADLKERIRKLEAIAAGVDI
ncbi:hypothetical protein GGR44_001599 [Sphingobium fontiphilum]|uniref:Uncharacterized protein n=1 Tax=Sphingobium fontiphilum TaxID=944425 RepID=A0A7W6DES7_9SPHN|nr:hypothetical protein [Sphingobium fontiphilum]MBB3981940.1 hypothetical protein [Sphingobium fontiphilum]